MPVVEFTIGHKQYELSAQEGEERLLKRAAAMLEASKAFTKEICDAVGAPTAAWARFTDAAAARAHVARTGAPIVVKADGLAAGKGVTVAMTEAEAVVAIDAALGGAFGEAGASVVIEEFMQGEEASFFVLVDGETCLPVGTAQDHKRAGDGDTGPNTGGMGAYSPAPVLTQAIQDDVMARIVRPTVAEMARRGTPFRGVLYAGLMIRDGQARLVEYNVRFGDPECQVLMMRLEDDLGELLLACAENRLAAAPPVNLAPDAALTLSFEADRDLIAQLQMKDVGLCADFAMGRAPRQVVRRQDLDYLYQRAAVARMTGALEGRDSPVERTDATDADYVAVYREMMRWSVPEALARQLIEKGLAGRTEDEQCDTAVAYYEAVLVQPTARATRLIADLQKTMAEADRQA